MIKNMIYAALFVQILIWTTFYFSGAEFVRGGNLCATFVLSVLLSIYAAGIAYLIKLGIESKEE